MKKCDKQNRKLIGKVMSNFDHEIDYDIAEQLIDTNTYAEYPARDFYANVWYQDGEYYCQIYQYGTHVDTINDKDISEIMNMASDKYGWNQNVGFIKG